MNCYYARVSTGMKGGLEVRLGQAHGELMDG